MTRQNIRSARLNVRLPIDLDKKFETRRKLTGHTRTSLAIEAIKDHLSEDEFALPTGVQLLLRNEVVLGFIAYGFATSMVQAADFDADQNEKVQRLVQEFSAEIGKML